MTILASTNPAHSRINEIFNQAPPAIFEIKVFFTNMNNDKLEIDVEHINRIDIFHDFISNYMESIELDFQVNVPQYQTMLKWYNELKCFVNINYFDEVKGIATGNFMKVTYRALLPDIKDIRKMLPQNELYDDTDNNKEMTGQKRGEMVTLKVQLIKQNAYEVAKLKMSTTINKGTVEQAILLMIETFKIKKFCMVPPDNKKVYDSLEIPPMKSIADMFNYLQYRYGVYNSHGGLYYDDGCLYVYPSFVFEGKSKDTFHIYKAPPGYLLGAKGTTIEENGDIFMFTNQLTVHKVTAVKELENVGNSYYSFDTNKLFNNWVQHTEGSSKISDDNADIFNANFAKGATEQTHVPQYETNNNNEFLIKSKLSALGVSTLDIGWVAAVPFLIKPFQKIMFHYEHGKKQKSIQCTCPVVTYMFKREAKLSRPLFTCYGNLKLFINNSTESFD